MKIEDYNFLSRDKLEGMRDHFGTIRPVIMDYLDDKDKFDAFTELLGDDEKFLLMAHHPMGLAWLRHLAVHGFMQACTKLARERAAEGN